MPRRASSSMFPLLLAAAGCGPSRPARVVPPPLDPAAVTAAIMAKADADADGILEKSELPAVPALAAAVDRLDVDHDGGLSATEVRQWLDRVKQSRVAITSFVAEVRHQGRPLANVTVKLVPESFMGTGMQAAQGVTAADGLVSATIPGGKYPGVNCGIYRIEIGGQGNDGKPLPARYNTVSTLGAAVGGELPVDGVTTLLLE